MISAGAVSRISLGVTLALFVIAVYTGSTFFWGVGHFAYSAPYTWYLLGFMIVATLYLAFGPLPVAFLESISRKLAALIWGRSVIPRLVLALCLTALFFLFRVGTAFLGDGYYLLNVFGRDLGYLNFVEKPLAIGIIKAVQLSFGGYTYATSLHAFQTISIVSGFFVILNFVAIAGSLSDSAKGRLFGLRLMIFSGWLLLFFGYIEYYPLLWLAATLFIRSALAFLKGRAPFWIVLLTFILSVGAHLQAVYFLPGLLYLAAHRISPRTTERMAVRYGRIVLPVMVLLLMGLVFAAGRLLPPVSNPFLPLVSFNAAFPDYAVISAGNLLEIANLIFLCVPGILILLALAYDREKSSPDQISRFLALASFGSIAFLATVNPVLGLARDFDLMTLTLFAPLLLLLYRAGGHREVPLRPMLFCTVLSLVATFSFLSANCRAESSMLRAHDLLKFYGDKVKSGWLSFERYLQGGSNPALHAEVASEVGARFPEYGRYLTAIKLISNGKFAEAEFLVQDLIKVQPENGEYLAALANIRAARGEYGQAIDLLKKAILTHPNHLNYLNLGRAYSKEGDFKSAIQALEQARTLASRSEIILTELSKVYYLAGRMTDAKARTDELLEINPRSLDGHIISMIYLADAGMRAEAARHYREFLQYGTNHAEYEVLKEKYKYLVGGK